LYFLHLAVCKFLGSIFNQPATQIKPNVKNESRFKLAKKLRISAVAALLALAFLFGGAEALLPDSLSIAGAYNVAAAVDERLSLPACTATVEDNNAVVKLLGVLPVKKVALNVLELGEVYPGGMAFGVKFFTEGVLVVGLNDIVGFSGTFCPAREAGIRKGDIILSINGAPTTGANALRDTVAASDGNALLMEIKREGEIFTTTLYPVLCDESNSYLAGLWVRDSTAGIGTVTYVNAKDLSFGGLGHGICDSDTGAIMPLGKAVVVDVDINGVRRGEKGAPGELKGSFGKVKRGVIDQNTETGVYGTLNELPSTLKAPMPIGLSHELKEGKAFIYTTLEGNVPEKFEIEIEKIYKNSGSTKNMMIKVTDPKLLRATGGIVQGMSGSPIIQNGKLVAAVTHVLIDDPTRGYGIFIENMLSTAYEADVQEPYKAA